MEKERRARNGGSSRGGMLMKLYRELNEDLRGGDLPGGLVGMGGAERDKIVGLAD